jgi:F0F1-type ATP synthase assembly protein I
MMNELRRDYIQSQHDASTHRAELIAGVVVGTLLLALAVTLGVLGVLWL